MPHIKKSGSKFLTKIKELAPGRTPQNRKKLVSLFKCVCGEEIIKQHDNVHVFTSCGCMGKRKKERKKIINKIVALKHRGYKRVVKITIVNQSKVIKKNSQSIRTHKLYYVWEGIRRRCYSKTHKKYHRYGGRGVVMCNEWKNSFYSFFDWSTANGYKEGLTIDKDLLSYKLGINPPIYSPGTCCFMSNEENRHIGSMGQ